MVRDKGVEIGRGGGGQVKDQDGWEKAMGDALRGEVSVMGGEGR